MLLDEEQAQRAIVEKIRVIPRPKKFIIGLVFFDVILIFLIGFFYFQKSAQLDPLDTEHVEQEIVASPTITRSVVNKKSVTLIPTKMPSIGSASTPTPTGSSGVVYLTPTSTPDPNAKDTTAPQITGTVGVDEGGTYAYSSTCIPIKAYDDVTTFVGLYFRFKMDSSDWTNWINDGEYCTQNLGNGAHSLGIEVRDSAGNVGSAIRNFIIQH